MEKMSPENRSRIMRGVRSKNTRPEVRVRKALHAAGLRFRLHVRSLPGTPDLVFPRYKAVVEIHGCFWHSHSCIGGRLPRTNPEFWAEKLKKNKERDRQKLEELKALGYRVRVVWECELAESAFDATILNLLTWIEDAPS
jgi:DNA mismatch endonuclease, patch repair protein